MKEHGTQIERILSWLETEKTITTAEAMTELGIYRLASRINDLRRRGYAIKKETVKGKNRFGETVRFAQYSLMEKEDE